MSGFFERLEAELRTSAHAQLGADLSRRRAHRLRMGALTVAVGVTAAVIALAAIVLLGHERRPDSRRTAGRGPAHDASGPPPSPRFPRRDQGLVTAVLNAEGAADRVDSACVTVPLPAVHPSVRAGDPPENLLRAIEVLRRPRGPGDRLPPRKTGDGAHSRPTVDRDGAYPFAQGIFIDDTRLARHRFGADYYLVPADNVNVNRPVPERCYALQREALRHALSDLAPSRLRTATEIQDRYITYERRRADPYPGVEICALDSSGNGGCSGFGVEQIDSGQTLTTGGPTGVGVVYGLAPDGVSRVTFVYGRSSHTVRVIDNVFILEDPHDRLPGDGVPDRLVWRSASGRVVRTVAH